MFAALCAEADMYVPAFPQMINYFQVQEYEIQLILSLNFAVLYIARLIVGPAIRYLRPTTCALRRTFPLFSYKWWVRSCGNFFVMIMFRIFQGVAASVPMVVSAAALFERYTGERANQLLGGLNSMITLYMAGAPIPGAWLSQVYNWRANFVVIFILTVIILVGTFLF